MQDDPFHPDAAQNLPQSLPHYAELQCVSNFSFLRGASHPEELVARAQQLGYAALALTDECSLSGVVRAHVQAKALALPLLIGSQFRIDDERGEPAFVLVVLVHNREGYGNLCELITLARTRVEKGSYLLLASDLDHPPPALAHLRGLLDCELILVPARSLTLPQLDHHAAWLGRTFAGRAQLGLTLLHLAGDEAHRLMLEQVAARHRLPLVATGDVLMHVRSRKPLQDTLTAIRCHAPVAECGYALAPNAEQHLRSRLRLANLYPRQALDNTLKIAQRCRFSLDELRYEYPDEVVPQGLTPAAYLRQETWIGAHRRFPAGVPAKVQNQLEHELTLIADMAYEPYFLTVYDIVRFARERRILCQGRGSAANSAVCYCLGITEVDPARGNMLFERFISKERNEPPDIDVDFEHQRREEVIQYIYHKYGRRRAALTGVVISYRPRSVLRDVGRALGVDAGLVDQVARSHKWWDGQEGLAARLIENGLDPEALIATQWAQMAAQLMGFPRHLSQHPGGFVIARGKLSRLVPIENAAMENRSVVQWDKDDLDALGLLKVDILALGMLSVIRRALDLVALRRGETFELQDIPPEDVPTYDMICQGDTVGVFQIESRAQMSMLPRLRPRKFYDLVIEVAIVRPGPIQGGMVHPYLRRRQGLEPVDYPGTEIEQALERTLGVAIFQEQVMQIAMLAGGFTAGEADQLRRAMAAWKRKANLDGFEQKLRDGMLHRGYKSDFVEATCKQIHGFAEYGFPESHAASFALLAYASSWLKCHEPAAFLAALLNSQPMGFYAPSQLVQDARRHGVVTLAVDVCLSDWEARLELAPACAAGMREQRRDKRQDQLENRPQGKPGGEPACKPEDRTQRRAEDRPGRQPEGRVEGEPEHRLEGKAQRREQGQQRQPEVRLGLNMVRGLSREAAWRIEEARAVRAFADVSDLGLRAQLERFDLQALAAAGALQSLAGNRRQALWQAATGVAEKGLLRAAAAVEEAVALAEPSEGQGILDDYRSLGLTLGRHPLALLRAALLARRFLPADVLNTFANGQFARGCGIVTMRQRPPTAKGTMFVTLEDETGTVNVIVWPALVESQRRELLGASLLGVYGIWQTERNVRHLVAKRLVDVSALLGRLSTSSRDFR